MNWIRNLAAKFERSAEIVTPDFHAPSAATILAAQAELDRQRAMIQLLQYQQARSALTKETIIRIRKP